MSRNSYGFEADGRHTAEQILRTTLLMVDQYGLTLAAAYHSEEKE